MDDDADDTLPVASLSRAARPTGTVLADRYRLDAMIGEGGMGTVFRAEDLVLDEWVALKTLRSRVADIPQVLERFRREVKLARRVTHPNVARVYELGQDRDLHFLTMELISGRSLAPWIAERGRADVSTAAPIVRQIARGIDAAHAAGVVHRDIKPENVLVEGGGRVAITDFGIARSLAGVSDTAGGDLVGTPAYMAPEQIEGGEITPRTDIYAFGAVLYVMLTGRLPWDGETPFALALARLKREPADPRTYAPELDRLVAEGLLACLSRAPEHRPSSATEVADLFFAGLPEAFVEPSRKVSAPAHLKIAVLPFSNDSGEDHVVSCVVQDLIDALGQLRSVRVLSGRMSERLADRAPADLARDLSVDRVVDGTIRKQADRYRIVIRAIDTRSGEQLFTYRVEVGLDGLISIGDDLASRLAESMNATPSAHVGLPALSSDAVELYLRARHHIRTHRPERAITLFAEAQARIPDHPLILSGLVMARLRQHLFSSSPDPTVLAWAITAASRAVEQMPNLAEAHVALASAHLHRGDAAGAVAALREALARAPSTGEALSMLGELLFEVGRTEEGVRRLELALDLDDANVPARAALSRERALAHDFESARFHLTSLHRKYNEPRLATLFARYALWQRDLAELARLADVLRSSLSDSTIFSRFPVDVVFGGMTHDEAFGRIDAVIAMPNGSWRTRLTGHAIRAEFAGFLGRTDLVIASVEAAADDRLHDLAWLDGCPLLEVARDRPEWLEIRRRVQANADAIIDAVW